MPWIVYIIECSTDGSLYTGITNNIEKRLLAHNNGTASKYTRSRRPVRLLKTFEVGNKSEALKLEYRIKKMSRGGKLELIGRII